MLKGIGKEATYFYHPDHLGSVSVVSNHKGEPYERVEYLPFGEVWIEDVDPATRYIPFRFTSKELDRETGLYYYGARYYEPKVSRWMSADPAGFALINPNRGGYSVVEAVNWYSYTSNNPVKYVDPTGMREMEGAGLVAGGYPPLRVPSGHVVDYDTEGNLLRGKDYDPVSSVVNIDRPTDGYGNDFDSTVTATTTMKNEQELSTNLGKVGANARNKKFANKHNGRTLPDADYSLKTEGGSMRPNSEGGYDSETYHNVYKIEIKSDDPNIPKHIRDSINSSMYLIHGTENKVGNTWNRPYSAGCISPPGNQPGQDRFIESINKLPMPIDRITLRIQSRIKVKTGVE